MGCVKDENFWFYGMGSLKIEFLGEGITKNQYIGANGWKRGTWTVYRFKGRARGKRRDGVFEGRGGGQGLICLCIPWHNRIYHVSLQANIPVKRDKFDRPMTTKKKPHHWTSHCVIIWVTAFKNRPSKICRRQTLKNLSRLSHLKFFKCLSSTNFSWSILEYLDPHDQGCFNWQDRAWRFVLLL